MHSDTPRNRNGGRNMISPENGTYSGNSPDSLASQQPHDQTRAATKRPLRVLKFGGTSVGDASCIARVADIIRTASCDTDVVVVVSAMSGVTNQLLEAASQAEVGNENAAIEILNQLRHRHDVTLKATVESADERDVIAGRMEALFAKGDRLCAGTSLSKESTLRTRDAISSLGERLSVLLLEAALRKRGVAAQAVEATELIVTDGSHGAADPYLQLTRERCEARLLPLIRKRVVPVVTGFIGATTEGVLTTLGRGGSDYSATILGAALGADEVVIWTDVDGMLTADPRLVPSARPISEISYREAAELAHFGAKVLHPKALRPVVHLGIPLWIRNTFSPDKPGTKITPQGLSNGPGVAGLAVVNDASLITVGGSATANAADVLERVLDVTRELRAEVLLISGSSSQNDICLVLPCYVAKRAVEELRRDFAKGTAAGEVEQIDLDSSVAVVTVVGKRIRGLAGILVRTFAALGRANVEATAAAHGASECNLSFVVTKKDVQPALVAIHHEFSLHKVNSPASSEIPKLSPVPHQSELLSASAD